MIGLKRILVPTDFSACAAAAVKYGRELAQHFNAELHVLHVVQDPYLYAWGTEALSISVYDDLVKGWQRGALAELRKLGPAAEADRTVLACPVGMPVDETLRYAREHRIDLIVLGTHGRGAMAHALLGSVAERVVRKSPCPVLTVHHLQHEFVHDSPAAVMAESL